MNKMIKGSLAGATGIAVLMGGFGTYALWTQEAVLEDSSISSGHLTVDAGTVGWNDLRTPLTLNDWDVTDDANGVDLMVPGDSVARTQTFTFSGAGKNLKGAISFELGDSEEPSNLAGTDPLEDAADAFSINVVLDGGIVNATEGNEDCWTFVVDSADEFSEVVDTTVTYALDADHTDLQNAEAVLEDSTFTVTQDGTCV